MADGWIEIDDFPTAEPGDAATREERARSRCAQLEAGHILFFPQLPFALPAEDRKFLVEQDWSDSRLHKNVSYRPESGVLRGFAGGELKRMQEVMRNYSENVLRFLGSFLSPYAGRWRVDFASFRPIEESGRRLSVHKRNDLLHVDSFPSRPTRGSRILRIFSNLHPRQARAWHTTCDFEDLAQRYAGAAGLKRFAAETGRGAQPGWLARIWGGAATQSTKYDRFMLRFHDYLKENREVQEQTPKNRLEFPPGSTWLVFTDGVAHAALSGQFALEQTVMIPLSALVAPQQAPVRILEGQAKCSLLDG